MLALLLACKRTRQQPRSLVLLTGLPHPVPARLPQVTIIGMAANLVAQNRQFAVDFQRSLLNIGLQCEERACINPLSTLGNALGYATYLEIAACAIVLLAYFKARPTERLDLGSLMAVANESIEPLRAHEGEQPTLVLPASLTLMRSSLKRTFSRRYAGDSASSALNGRGWQMAAAADAAVAEADCVLEVGPGGRKPEAGAGRGDDAAGGRD